MSQRVLNILMTFDMLPKYFQRDLIIRTAMVDVFTKFELKKNFKFPSSLFSIVKYSKSRDLLQ